MTLSSSHGRRDAPERRAPRPRPRRAAVRVAVSVDVRYRRRGGVTVPAALPRTAGAAQGSRSPHRRACRRSRRHRSAAPSDHRRRRCRARRAREPGRTHIVRQTRGSKSSSTAGRTKPDVRGCSPRPMPSSFPASGRSLSVSSASKRRPPASRRSPSQPAASPNGCATARPDAWPPLRARNRGSSPPRSSAASGRPRRSPGSATAPTAPPPAWTLERHLATPRGPLQPCACHHNDRAGHRDAARLLRGRQRHRRPPRRGAGRADDAADPGAAVAARVARSASQPGSRWSSRSALPVTSAFGWFALRRLLALRREHRRGRRSGRRAHRGLREPRGTTHRPSGADAGLQPGRGVLPLPPGAEQRTSFQLHRVPAPSGCSAC